MGRFKQLTGKTKNKAIVVLTLVRNVTLWGERILQTEEAAVRGGGGDRRGPGVTLSGAATIGAASQFKPQFARPLRDILYDRLHGIYASTRETA
jgi:hypothetical protein